MIANTRSLTVEVSGVHLPVQAFLAVAFTEGIAHLKRTGYEPTEEAIESALKQRVGLDRARLASYAERDALEYACGALLEEILEYHRPDAEHEAAWRAYVGAVRDSLVRPLEAA